MAGKGINITITADPATTQAALQLVRRELKETGEAGKREASQIAEGMETIKRSLETIGISLALREVVGELKELVAGSLEFGEQMTKASQRTGLAVDTLSTLHYAAQVTNSDFDGLVNGIGKMNKLIGEAADGQKKAAGFVRGLGLDAKDLASRTDGAEIAFHRLIDRLAATENPIRRNQLAMTLLGKAGSAQIPVLIDVAQHWDEFKERAEAAGVQLNAETAKQLEDTNRRLADMKQHIQGAGLELTEGLTPALSAMLGVISGGKSNMQTMIELGQMLGKSFAFVGEVMYTAAAGAEKFFGAIEGGKLTGIGKKDLGAGDELLKKAQQMHDIAFGNPKELPGIPGEGGSASRVGGFEGNDGAGGKGAKPKSDDAIAVAAAALLAEQGKLAADMQKHIDQAALAELDAQHRMMIVHDQEYNQEKLRLQEDALTVEEKALTDKLGTLAALNEKQKGDKLLKRDKGGHSVEELKTQREMVQVQEQLNALEARHQELRSGAGAEQDASNRKAELAGLKLLAEVERERNAGLTAQIALIRREKELEAQKVTNEGGTPADAENIRALGEIEVRKLRIADVSREIAEREQAYKVAIEDVNDAAAKDPRLKRQATQAINGLNKQEAAELQALVVQYDALAAELGGDFIQKARELHLELDKLNRPDQREDAAFSKALGEGIEGISRKLADATASGESFRKTLKGVGKDALDLAIKLAEQRWITPALTGTGGKLPGFGGGFPGLGQAAQLGVPQQAKASPAAAILDALPGFGKLSGKGGGQGITIKIDNQSSTPVAASQASASLEADLHETVVHVVLKDLSMGGVLSKAFGLG